MKKPPRAEGNSRADDNEGMTRITNQGGPVGVVWLRDFAGLGQFFRLRSAGSAEVSGSKPIANDATAPTKNADPQGQGTRLSAGTLQRLPTTSVPVMVAPLDSCTPIDAGQIEDLLFADPATADRIIRAAGQGFRVVVLSPVADPNPRPEPHDCPRPAGHDASPPIAADRTHPEPTPVQQDPEGRVQMRAVPRPIAGNQNTGSGVPATSAVRTQPSAFGVNVDSSEQPGIVITSRRGNVSAPRPAKPAPGLLVPPAPEFEMGVAFPIAISPDPPQVITDLSPADHLRIAASKLEKQGLADEAEQLRSTARDLDSQIDKRLAAIRSQQEQLAAEAARLTALRDPERQIRMNALIVEVNRKRMATAEGVKLVRRYLEKSFDDKAPFWSQVTTAALHPEFIREAGQKGFLNVLSRPQVLTTPGQEATIHIGSRLFVPIPGGQPQARDFGILLTLTPHLDEGGRLRLEAAPEVSRVDHSNSLTVAGQVVPGLHTRRRQTEVKVSFGQTVAMGGFSSPTPHLQAGDIQQTAGEDVDPRAENYEILFLVTPVAQTESSESPW